MLIHFHVKCMYMHLGKKAQLIEAFIRFFIVIFQIHYMYFITLQLTSLPR